MGMHEKAWSGLSIVIFGRTPLIPMRVEQAIAAAAPALETRTDSFEDYAQAFDHCKEKKSVGFILLHENCGELPIESVFKQLASHYEAKGVPCFGVLLHEGTKSFSGYQAMSREPRLIDYIPASDLLEPANTGETLLRLWHSYAEAFEAILVPEKLQSTLECLVASQLDISSIEFQRRTTTLLTANLNISWVEQVALKWVHVIQALKASGSEALKANQGLEAMCKLAEFSTQDTDAIAIAQSRKSLCSRTASIVHLLNVARLNGTLPEFLALVSTQSKPGAAALIRHLAMGRSRIIRFSEECKHVERQENFG
jgi:hypothetical protein